MRDRDDDEYDLKRRPAYTVGLFLRKLALLNVQDRILYRSNSDNHPLSMAIRCIQYDSIPSLRMSDHKPVFALLKVNIVPDRRC